jgi:iron complex outermembrane receptor protein
VSPGVTFNLAAFRNLYRNQQLLITTVSATTGLLVVRTENAGRSRIQGLEAEMSARITPELRLTGALGLLDAKYQQYISVIAGVPTDVSNRRPKQAPKVTASGSLAYETDLSSTVRGAFRVDATYRSNTFIDVENTPLLRAPSHALVNASATFSLPANGLSLRLAVDNLTDKQVPIAGYDGSAAFGFVEGYFSDPRRWSATVAYKF